MEKKPLNMKQKLFCERYIKDFNATQSYLEVYGCEYDTARANAPKLLKREDIRLYIQDLIKENVSQDLTADRILYELMDLAFNHDGSIPPNIRLQALQHLSKLMGMEVTKVQMEQVVFVGEDDIHD